MKDKKTNWYLIDIIAKFQTAPLQTISYLMAFGAEIISVIAAVGIVVYYRKFGGQRTPYYSYSNGIFYMMVEILFLISFLLLCVAYLKSNVGWKKILMCIGTLIVVLGILVVLGLEVLLIFSIRVSVYAFTEMYFRIMFLFVLLPVILAIMDINLRLYMKKWLFSCIRALVVIPFLLVFCSGIDIIIAIFLVLVYIFLGLRYMCPNCKKGYALKKVNTVVMGERDISVKKQERTVQYNNSNQEISHSVTEKYVPGTETTYGVNYICRYCGRECRKTRIEKTANE